MENNMVKYDNLAQGVIQATGDGKSSLVLLCLTDLSIEQLSGSITQHCDNNIDYISYENTIPTGDIGIGEHKIFINPIPQYYNIDDYISLPKIIVSSEANDIEKTMQLVRNNVEKKLDNPSHYSQQAIVRLLERELLEYVTKVEQDNTKNIKEELNKTMKDSILNGGKTDYSLHPEGVSPWKNDLI